MLTHWCKPPDPMLWPLSEMTGSIGARMEVLTASLQSVERYEVALMGSGEGADRMRAALYTMQDAFPGLAMIDLGNLRRPQPEFAIPLLQELLDARIVPVWMGQDAPLVGAALSAYRIIERSVRWGSLHASAAEEEDTDTAAPYAVLAHQTHLTPPAYLGALRERGTQLCRLGEVQRRPEQTEPILRNLDLLHIHAACVEEAALPAQVPAGSVGLRVAEVCQAAYYAGASDRLSSLVLNGWDPKGDTNDRSARALATIVWYFLDGVAHRQGDFPISKGDMTEFVVQGADHLGQTTFWKSERSGRWWVEVSDERQQPVRKHLLACNHADCTELTKGHITPYLLQLLGHFV